MNYWRITVGIGVICLCLWLVACAAQVPPRTLTPIDLPPITLTLWLIATPSLHPFMPPITATSLPITPMVYQAEAGETWEQLAQNFDTELSVLQTLNPSQGDLGEGSVVNVPSLHGVELHSPLCSLTIVEELICLGYVRNQRDTDVGEVTLRADLYDVDGALLSTRAVSVEQRWIPPNTDAPYRVIFEGESASMPYRALVVSLERVDPLKEPHVSLNVSNARVERDADLFTVVAQVENVQSAKVYQARVVVTVYAGEQRVLGYRVIEFGELAPGEWIPLRVPMGVENGERDVRYVLHTEAQVENDH
ncbi:MAG: FxLYD domain-containing protein [Anaerolineae bacterium]|nr:FxLYD domain-containing protein [Anaerolineae bacterium]